jgi:hypothetical protein
VPGATVVVVGATVVVVVGLSVVVVVRATVVVVGATVVVVVVGFPCGRLAAFAAVGVRRSPVSRSSTAVRALVAFTSGLLRRV